MALRDRRHFWIGLALVLVIAAAGAAYWLIPRPAPAPRLTLKPARFDQFQGWAEDSASAAVPALLRSCKKILAKPDAAPIDVRPRGADFGQVGEWRPVCERAAALPSGDDAAARRFFEADFVPLLAGNNGDSKGLFTGYFEVTLRGSRKRGRAYRTPLYRMPPEPKRHTRAEIEDGALSGKGLELLWVDSPIDAFFLEIQGSGRVKLAEGGVVRVGYDAQNGQPYVPVGRLLIERGEIPREKVTMAAIRAWMEKSPKDGAALRRENPSYVFFREISGDGPLGAQQVPLTPGRSLAVDRAFLPLGVPLWVDVRQRFAPNEVIRRLVVAQDTGGAIKGPVRGDLFWGHGQEAANGAGAMNATGRYYLLVPKPVAVRLGGAVTH